MKTLDLFGKPLNSGQRSVLGKRFRWPPFDCFNARDGDWQDRKRQWIALGIQSELGRGETLTWGVEDIDEQRHKIKDRSQRTRLDDATAYPAQSYRMDQYIDDYRPKKKNATPGGSPMPAMDYKDKERGDGRGKPIKQYHAQPGGGPGRSSVWLGSKGRPVGGDTAVNAGNGKEEGSQTGTSIFDPVLCELIYRWFVPKDGIVLDPFAGGSVRGIVASVLGRRYIGLDLRPEQVRANRYQADVICKPDNQPEWVVADSMDIIDVVDEKVDCVFSCPPYFDLEQYSGHENDLSNMTWKQFCNTYEKIIENSVSLLKSNRFACFVVGDIRDKRGFYRSLPALTIDCFENAGCRLYNQAMLMTAVGSLPLRIHQQFSKSRKLGRTYQQVLVFAKGDPWKAAAECEDIELLSIDIAKFNDIAKNV